MEQINSIELNDENVYPDEKIIKSILGISYLIYIDLLALFNKYKMVYNWRYYKDGKAWLCKVQKGNRTIVWMSAWKGYIKATIYFPEKYISNLNQLNISNETINAINNTKNVGKSKPCMFDMQDKKILSEFEIVMMYKMKTK